MAAADEAILLNSVCQELGSTQRKSDLGQQVRQQRLPLVTVVMDPGKHSLKNLRGYSTAQSACCAGGTGRFLILRTQLRLRGSDLKRLEHGGKVWWQLFALTKSSKFAQMQKKLQQ